MPDLIQLQLTRYHPERDSAPSTQTFSVPLQDDWTVLDALNYIKDKQDGSLTFRWSCRMGVCGSCGMMVNGVPKLTCATFLVDYAGQRPHPRRALASPHHPRPVVDITDFSTSSARSNPGSSSKRKAARRRRVQANPAQLDQYKQFSMCINCLLCYAACPVIGLEPGFLGPAVIALARRYNLDNRDQGGPQRMELCTEHDGIWQCTFVGECSKVCPKNVDPAGAIQQYKIAAALHSLKSLLLPRGAR
jgi:fumarate reductase iron-sulfur subunit